MTNVVKTVILVSMIGCLRAETIAAKEFANCVIVARRLSLRIITKYFTCGDTIVSVSGSVDDSPDGQGRSAHREFGMFWSGELSSFGVPPQPSSAFTQCRVGDEPANGMVTIGGDSNYAGYQSHRQKFRCAEGVIKLAGLWEEEIQANWVYNLQLGEVHMEPQWVSDKFIKDLRDSTYQKWCPTRYGMRLCGWIDEPKIDHGTPPTFKRSGK